MIIEKVLNLNQGRRTYKTYLYEVFQNCTDEIPDLQGLKNFFESVLEKNVDVYFEVLTSKEYASKYQLIGEIKNLKIFKIKEFILDEHLFDCLSGCVYFIKRGYTEKQVLEYLCSRKCFSENILAMFNLNDIYECSLETSEVMKKELFKLVEYYGDSEKNIKIKHYYIGWLYTKNIVKKRRDVKCLLLMMNEIVQHILNFNIVKAKKRFVLIQSFAISVIIF